ncbi:hypothetical protein BOTCAL_0351g00020 [Botryotinia calthae]|uniref:Uncharacterized protein n=1 Tax=Botryotinia calthae TaxID=38488 RepID=A0A4Y8CSF9_9HELO|nr:hypothetical protein BOTCAL_0351g00020 [Botryotinia calthae]
MLFGESEDRYYADDHLLWEMLEPQVPCRAHAGFRNCAPWDGMEELRSGVGFVAKIVSREQIIDNPIKCFCFSQPIKTSASWRKC